MKSAFLFGPFVGSLSYELFRFAPYAIYIKKKHPKHKILVYTRPERFDLYGTYADILIPLSIRNDNILLQNQYKLKDLSNENYKKMIEIFHRKYKDHYNIKNHIYPDIFSHKSSLKWQIPKTKMDYDFSPRFYNNISEILPSKYILIDLSGLYMNESFYRIEYLDRIIDKSISFVIYDPLCDYTNILFTSRTIINLNDTEYNMKKSLIGFLINAIKNSIYTLSFNFSDCSHLSLLLKKKLFLSRSVSSDYMKSINPFDTEYYILPNDNSLILNDEITKTKFEIG